MARISHLVLPVGDVPASRDWYVDKLGFRVERERDGVKFVSPPKLQFWGYGAEVLDPDGYTNHLWDEVTMAKATREMREKAEAHLRDGL